MHQQFLHVQYKKTITRYYEVEDVNFQSRELLIDYKNKIK